MVAVITAWLAFGVNRSSSTGVFVSGGSTIARASLSLSVGFGVKITRGVNNYQVKD